MTQGHQKLVEAAKKILEAKTRRSNPRYPHSPCYRWVSITIDIAYIEALRKALRELDEEVKP
jgi:hypothetical protein